ncbi:MAG TPA: EthD domain-containing protein [Mycobacterium sp.]
MAVPSFVGVLGRSPEDLPSGRPQVRDRHLKFHEERDNLPQQFADYYEHNHVPLVLSKAFMPMVYKRNYIQRGDAFNIEGDEIGFDCMTELVFADRDDLLAWMTSLGVDEIARDEENFIDRTTTRAYVVDERTSAG